MINMRNMMTLGKTNFLSHINKMKIKTPQRLFTNKEIEGIIKEKDNFCFNKDSLLTDNQSNLNANINENMDENFKVTQKIVGDGIILEKKEENVLDTMSKNKRFYKDVMELTKFKLCVLNTTVAVSTYAFYSTGAHLLIDFVLFTGGTLCISMTTQVINQIVEKYHDKKMRRTSGRPLPKQRMTDKTASMIGITLWLSSIGLYSLTCPHAILFSNGILLLYIGAYTPLKRYSNLSMHVGAVVGGLPALLGSYAATGFLLEESALLLAAYIYAWQYPHFYGILYQNKEDYKKAGFNFISNHEDRNYISYIQMILAMIAMMFIVYRLYVGKNHIMNTACFVTFIAFYIKNFVPVYKFIFDPSKYAKTIRKESYMPFLIVLFAFMYSSIEMRRKTIREKKEKDEIQN